MTKEEQKRLYEHYLNMSKHGINDNVRSNCKKYMEEVLKSYPEFGIKEVPKKEVLEESKEEIKEIKSKEKK